MGADYFTYCGQCIFSQKRAKPLRREDKYAQDYECRKDPPLASAPDGWGQWPGTSEHGWCGEGKAPKANKS